MRRIVLKLEKPGWEQARAAVDKMLAAGYSFGEIVDAVNVGKLAPERLHLSGLQRYHRQKYARVAQMMEAAAMQAETALTALKKFGSPNPGEMARMALMESFLQNQHKLAEADPIKVGWLQVQYEHVAQQREQLEHEKRELDLKVEEMRSKAEKARKAIDDAIAENRSLDPDTMRRIREEVYGIASAA